jgi:predicted Zn-dependent protease
VTHPATLERIAFYRARLDEMERAAKQTNEDEYAWNVSISTSYGSVDHAELHTPSRALRRVAAGRKLIALCSDEKLLDAGHLDALDLAISEWDDHPDFDPRWKL